MVEERGVVQRLHDILENTEFIIQTMDSTSPEVFFSDVLYSAAVSRAFEIIGEASKHVPHNVQSAYPQIPWNDMIIFGDLIAHEYRKMSINDVWWKANNQIPKLYDEISQMIVNVEKEQE